jgi:hypothetical protein
MQAIPPACSSEGVGLIRRAIVGHHPAHADAALAKPGDGAVEKSDRAFPSLVGQELDVGQAARVVYADMSKFPAHPFDLVEARIATGDAMADALDSSELFRVDVDQVTGVRPLIPVRWLRWLQEAKPRKSVPYECPSYRRPCQTQPLRDLLG